MTNTISEVKKYFAYIEVKSLMASQALRCLIEQKESLITWFPLSSKSFPGLIDKKRKELLDLIQKEIMLDTAALRMIEAYSREMGFLDKLSLKKKCPGELVFLRKISMDIAYLALYLEKTSISADSVLKQTIGTIVNKLDQQRDLINLCSKKVQAQVKIIQDIKENNVDNLVLIEALVQTWSEERNIQKELNVFELQFAQELQQIYGKIVSQAWNEMNAKRQDNKDKIRIIIASAIAIAALSSIVVCYSKVSDDRVQQYIQKSNVQMIKLLDGLDPQKHGELLQDILKWKKMVKE